MGHGDGDRLMAKVVQWFKASRRVKTFYVYSGFTFEVQDRGMEFLGPISVAYFASMDISTDESLYEPFRAGISKAGDRLYVDS